MAEDADVLDEVVDEWWGEANGIVPEFRINPLPAGQGYFELRPYQGEAADRVFEELNIHPSTLVVMPTGTGKTVLFAEIALRWPDNLGRVLVLAHREELIDQAAEKIGLHLGDMPGIEMGARREATGMLGPSKVLVASVQTLQLARRAAKFNPRDFGLVVIDEAHHSPAKGYRTVVEYFAGNPNIRILGVTATPKRHDKAALGDIFRSVAYEMDLPAGIKQGWLVDIEQKLVVVEGLDFSKCRTTAGDLNGKDLELQMLGGAVGPLTELQREQIEQQEKMLHAVVSPAVAEAQGRPTIVFGVTKAHAERLCEIFNRHPGVTAEFVTDETPSDERKAIIARFKGGATQFLCGVGIFTEGFDARADVIVVARPTKSTSLYIQMIGRGTRPLPGLVDKYDAAQERREAIANSAKPCVTVLDFVGTSGQHSLVSTLNILGGEYSEDVLEAARRRLALTGETLPVDELLEEEQAAEEERKEDEKRRAQLEREERERLLREREEQRRKQREREAEERRSVRAQAMYRTESVNPFAGQPIPEQVGVGMFRGGASDKQIKLLMRLGIPEEKACSFTRGQAGQVIDKIKKQTGAEYVMPIGKHRGKKLCQIPRDYLNWALQNMGDQEVQKNIREHFGIASTPQPEGDF